MPLEKYAGLAEHANAVILWDFVESGRGDAWSSGREHVTYDQDLRDHVAAVKAAGMRPLLYMTPWYYYSSDPDEFLGEVARLKDTYGLEGVYYDGVSDQWLRAYTIMRRTRELFPDGMIVLHDTQPVPLMESSLVTPAVQTYADATYIGELVYGRGKDWVYPRYIPAQFRTANCVGMMIHDKWEGLGYIAADLTTLLHNGRALAPWVWWTEEAENGLYGEWKARYLPVLAELRTLWQEKGDASDFYERYYLPAVESLTGNASP